MTSTSMPDDETLTTGTVINGRYVIESRIGSGGFSEVLAAHDRSANRSVALKMLHRDATTNDPRAVARMRQEAEILQAISHPNIVQIYAVDTYEDAQFLVMERVEGIGFDELLIRDQTVDSRRLVPLVRQLLDALDAAHQTDILHRDLKPENLLLTSQNGREILKLVDFGIAKAGAALNAEHPEDGVTLVKTRAGTFIGTPRYAAPEMVVGDPPSPASDLFCVGLIVYEALMGQPLISGQTENELLNELVFPRPFDFEEVPAPWSEWLEEVLEKSPDHRLGSCSKALRRLDELFPSHGTNDSAGEAMPADIRETDEDELHPRFDDSVPMSDDTAIDSRPDFAALDAAASSLGNDEETVEVSTTDLLDVAETTEQQSLTLDYPSEELSNDNGTDTDEPDDTPDDSGSDDTNSVETVLTFLLIALLAFVIAGITFMVLLG